MDFRFYHADPEPTANVQWPAAPQEQDEEPAFVLVALERNSDPDARVHDGFDYYGAYGDAAAIEAWAADQPVVAIEPADFPVPLSFYPAPFNQA